MPTPPKHNALSEAGIIFKLVFKDVTEVAVDAEPVVDLLFPGIALLFNAAATAAARIEASIGTSSNGSKGASNQTKIQALVTAITPAFISYAASQKLLPPTQAEITAFAVSFLTMLGAIPAPQASVSTPPPAK